MDIYVGNLPFTIEEADLEAKFASFGKVDRVNMIIDRETGRFKGFAFVTMPDAEEAHQAIEGINGQDIGGRDAKVNEARKRN